MQNLSFFSFRMVVVIISAFCFAKPCLSQVSNNNSDTYLGKINVYKFSMDSLYYHGVKLSSAVGRELSAELYSSKVGDNIYFRISIEGDIHAVVSNPYGTRVSSDNYYYAWILKNGQYVRTPDLAYMAGSYFLTLPYAKTDDKRNANTTANVPSNSTPASSTSKQVNWQPLGKVRVVSDMRTTRSHGEEDVIYDEDSLCGF